MVLVGCSHDPFINMPDPDKDYFSVTVSEILANSAFVQISETETQNDWRFYTNVIATDALNSTAGADIAEKVEAIIDLQVEAYGEDADYLEAIEQLTYAPGTVIGAEYPLEGGTEYSVIACYVDKFGDVISAVKDYEFETPVAHFTVSTPVVDYDYVYLSIERDNAEQGFYYFVLSPEEYASATGDDLNEKADALFKDASAFWVSMMGEERGYAMTLKTDNIESEYTGYTYNYTSTFTQGQEYYVLVAYFDTTGKLIGNAEIHKIHTLTLEPSDNKITLEITEVKARSIYFNITTTNDDPYALMIAPAESFKGKEGQELLDALVAHFQSTFGFTQTGDLSSYFSDDIEAETEYIVAAWGYAAGTATTDPVYQYVTTKEKGDYTKWNFTVTFSETLNSPAKGYYLDYVINPNDESIDYCYALVHTGYTPETFKETWEANVKATIESGGYFTTYPQYYQATATHGEKIEVGKSIVPGTELKVAAFAVDVNEGKIIGDVIFSEESYKAEIPDRCDYKGTVSLNKYWKCSDVGTILPIYADESYANLAYCKFAPAGENLPEGHDGQVYFWNFSYVDQWVAYGMADVSEESLLATMLDLFTRRNYTWYIEFNMETVCVAVGLDKTTGLFGKEIQKYSFTPKESECADISEFQVGGSYVAKKADAKTDKVEAKAQNSEEAKALEAVSRQIGKFRGLLYK